jgi:hypothetical protein
LPAVGVLVEAGNSFGSDAEDVNFFFEGGEVDFGLGGEEVFVGEEVYVDGEEAVGVADALAFHGFLKFAPSHS